jgi:phosphoribosylaminoimidazole-succinocarboxamide synthase
MKKGELLYEGKAKRLYLTDEEDVLWVEYKDSATAFNAVKKATIEGKGVYNNEISSLLFEKLKQAGIENHFIERISETEQLVQKTSIIPLEVVVRNVIAGSLAKRLGMEEGTLLPNPIVEFYYKDDTLGDPLVTRDHIAILQAATKQQLIEIREKALQVNELLLAFFYRCNVRLVDFKLEFGLTKDNRIILADEISPDTCRLWDLDTNRKLDKDVFRRDLGSLTEAYAIIWHRLKEDTHV